MVSAAAHLLILTAATRTFTLPSIQAALIGTVGTVTVVELALLGGDAARPWDEAAAAVATLLCLTVVASVNRWLDDLCRSHPSDRARAADEGREPERPTTGPWNQYWGAVAAVVQVHALGVLALLVLITIPTKSEMPTSMIATFAALAAISAIHLVGGLAYRRQNAPLNR